MTVKQIFIIPFFTISTFVFCNKLIAQTNVNEQTQQETNTQVEFNKEIIMDSIYFGYSGGHPLRLKSLPHLDKLIELLNKLPNVHVEIGSHIDARGTDKLNDKLSELRARRVTEYLIYKGFDSERISYKGYGKRKLVIKKC